MTMNDLLVPYLSYDEIRKHAENFLYQYNINDTIPVPIEKIIEIDLNISLIAYSGANRPPIPIHFGHHFRSNSATQSGANRPPLESR